VEKISSNIGRLEERLAHERQKFAQYDEELKAHEKRWAAWGGVGVQGRVNLDAVAPVSKDRQAGAVNDYAGGGTTRPARGGSGAPVQFSGRISAPDDFKFSAQYMISIN
jgi:hypothetical protein